MTENFFIFPKEIVLGNKYNKNLGHLHPRSSSIAPCLKITCITRSSEFFFSHVFCIYPCQLKPKQHISSSHFFPYFNQGGLKIKIILLLLMIKIK